MATKRKRPALKRRSPLAIDLFAGSGGLTLGLKQAGFRVVGAIEADALAAETYHRNHRATTLWNQDIRVIEAAGVRHALRLRRGQLHLLAGVMSPDVVYESWFS
jgi:DNA (cytosine-5)-methyltransferase 1